MVVENHLAIYVRVLFFWTLSSISLLLRFGKFKWPYFKFANFPNLSLLLNLCNKFFISVIVFFSFRVSVWFFYIISLYWYSHFVLMSMFFRFPLVLCSFSSSSLSIYNTVILESLSSKSNAHIPSWMVYRDLLCFFGWTMLFCFFVCLVKIWHLKNN